MAHEPPRAVFLSIYYLEHSFGILLHPYVYRQRFFNQTTSRNWTQELKKGPRFRERAECDFARFTHRFIPRHDSANETQAHITLLYSGRTS